MIEKIKILELVNNALEGSDKFLVNLKITPDNRIYVDIDGDNGVTIDDCTLVSHAIDPVIDEADPIDKQYYLEVCSPGIERELTRDWHFERTAGSKVSVKLFSAIDGKKEFCGTLGISGEEISIITEDGQITFDKSKIAKATTIYED